MDRLLKIVRAATPCTGVQFRKRAYGSYGIRRFLRDVMALANAGIEGARYIVVGVQLGADGERRAYKVPQHDFAGKPSYQSLVTDNIEPPIRLRYHAVTLEGTRVGVFEIGDCQDRPYMMRVDHSERLRRGDAYVRVDCEAIKLGRRQLQDMFEQKFRDAVSADRIEIGFPGEIIHKQLHLETVDLSRLPSAVASTKLKQLVSMRRNSRSGGFTTTIARLTHARLFGTENPYENRSTGEVVLEIDNLRNKHRHEDQHFLYETSGSKLQLVVFNQGGETIEDASISLVMPNHTSFYVARRLPRLRKFRKFVERHKDELARYPAVNVKDDAVHVSAKLGDLLPNSPIEAFDAPLRICVGSELGGRRLGIRYALHARNLRSPATGKLRLIF